MCTPKLNFRNFSYIFVYRYICNDPYRKVYFFSPIIPQNNWYFRIRSLEVSNVEEMLSFRLLVLLNPQLHSFPVNTANPKWNILTLKFKSLILEQNSSKLNYDTEIWKAYWSILWTYANTNDEPCFFLYLTVFKSILLVFYFRVFHTKLLQEFS